MPSDTLLDALNYQLTVNRIMIDRGRQTHPLLSTDELLALTHAYNGGVCPFVFAAMLPDRNPEPGIMTDVFAMIDRRNRAIDRERDAKIVEEMRAHGMAVIAEAEPKPEPPKIVPFRTAQRQVIAAIGGTPANERPLESSKSGRQALEKSHECAS